MLGCFYTVLGTLNSDKIENYIPYFYFSTKQLTILPSCSCFPRVRSPSGMSEYNLWCSLRDPERWLRDSRGLQDMESTNCLGRCSLYLIFPAEAGQLLNSVLTNHRVASSSLFHLVYLLQSPHRPIPYAHVYSSSYSLSLVCFRPHCLRMRPILIFIWSANLTNSLLRCLM